MRRDIEADVVRCKGRYSFLILVRLLLFDRTFRVVGTMRMCQASNELPLPLRPVLLTACRLLHRISQQLAAVDLPWRTRISGGFRIIHGWGLVINPEAVIGRNVTMLHGATLGQKDRISEEGREISYPVVEDEVWIGPHAVIVGGVTVGRGSRIGACAVVVNDVAPHSTVVGNPAKVVATDVLPDVLYPA